MYPSVLKCTKCNKYYTFTPYIYKAYPLMEHHLSGVAAKVSLSLFHELAVLECFPRNISWSNSLSKNAALSTLRARS